MFKILDGRDKFYQWDINRKLIVDDPTITQVHFCNRTDNCSLVCETFKEDGLTVVNVPNILLQSDWKIRVYAYDGEHTKHDACYEVASRTKPTDYAYTETEVLNYSALEERIENIEQNSAAFIVVDDAMSMVSTNPVQNKVVTQFINNQVSGVTSMVASAGQTASVAKITAENAERIAKGRATGYAFDTEADMNNWLNNVTFKESLVHGDNLYIRALNVPDYWWDAENQKAYPLETQKVNMTEYVLKTAFNYDEDTETLTIII